MAVSPLDVRTPAAVADIDRGLLRVATMGSVDDGKSTLLGRLLHDTRSVADDTLAAVRRASMARAGAADDAGLALLTDGLRAEREEGITIDVAYRYFSTPRRSFVLADTPGHLEFTRNTATGASTADVALVLVDARSGVVDQTRRHVAIASLLRVPHLLFCLNKIDLVGYDPTVVADRIGDVLALADRADIPDATVVPVSALIGDNVVSRSARTPWYPGPVLLEHLEQVEVPALGAGRARFAVQHVLAPVVGGPLVAGQVGSGVLRPGDELVVLPSGRRTRLTAVLTADGALPEAPAGRSVALRLIDAAGGAPDVRRGDMLAAPGGAPTVGDDLEAEVCWMAARPLRVDDGLLLRHTTREVPAVVREVGPRLSVTTGRRSPVAALEANDIGRVCLSSGGPLAYDPYVQDRGTGSILLLDEATGDTLGAGMLR